MDIQHEAHDHKGEFFYEKAGRKVGKMTYSMAGTHKMIIDHTEVDESERGEHVGVNLVKAGVDYAREKEIQILPLCPFAAAILKKKTEWRDVLVK